MTTGLRALVEKWRQEAVKHPHSGLHAYNNCADELQAALDAQAGMVCVGWEEYFDWPAGAWVRYNDHPEWSPPAGWPANFRRIYAGPVEGGEA